MGRTQRPIDDCIGKGNTDLMSHRQHWRILAVIFSWKII